MELKCGTDRELVLRQQGLNRTIMELKLNIIGILSQFVVSLNRTIMELKWSLSVRIELRRLS